MQHSTIAIHDEGFTVEHEIVGLLIDHSHRHVVPGCDPDEFGGVSGMLADHERRRAEDQQQSNAAAMESAGFTGYRSPPTVSVAAAAILAQQHADVHSVNRHSWATFTPA